MQNNLKFLIYANRYDDNSGGTVVLHKLCHLLNENNFEAYLWPNYKPIFNIKKPLNSIFSFFKYIRKSRRKFKMNNSINTPIAKYSDLACPNVIVVYSEIVDGNPLNAKNIVRWLLHKPGYHTNGNINYGSNELFFHYVKAYIDNTVIAKKSNELFIANSRADQYYQSNFGSRKNSCYILRKGRDRKIVHNIDNSILIDGKSHSQIAKIFNSVEQCISYDTYTMFSIYAVMCGCKSIIIPEDGISKEQWQPNIKDRYGLAYGFNDLEEAEKTKKLLLESLKIKDIDNNNTVKKFASLCVKYFNINKGN